MFNKLFNKTGTKSVVSANETNGHLEIDFDIYWLQRELEFQHQEEKFQFRANDNQALKFGEVINSLFDLRKDELSYLTINDGNLSSVEGAENIWNYDFLQQYKRNEKGEYCYFKEGCGKLNNQIVMTLSYRTNESNQSDNDKSISNHDAMLIVHLQYPLGLMSKAFYIQATFCRPTILLERDKKGMSPQPEYLSILIAYDYRATDENTKEFFNVYNSAKDKISKGNTSQFNYLEMEIAEVLYHPQIAKEFFFGKKAMTENRYCDAISYFDNAFKALQNKWWKEQLSDEEFQTLLECSFLIGYCYYALGLFDKAFKYLEFPAKNGGQAYKYHTEYLNCLIALHDIRSLTIIDHHFKNLESKAVEESTDLDYHFYMFLLRRKAYCFIELGQFEQAEIYLHKILENEPENKFAQEELLYIKNVKQK